MIESTHSTRRAFFAGATAAILATNVSSTALAATHPDAELLALGECLEELSKAHVAAEGEAERLYEVYLKQQPSRPEALIWKPSDPDSGLFPPTFRDEQGRRVWHHHDEINRLRIFEGHGYLRAGDRERAVKRAKEIAEAFDAWNDAKERVREKIGYKEAGTRSEALFNQVHSLGKLIAKLPAQTLAGLIVKARAVEIFNDEARDGDLRDDPTSDLRVAGGIVRDLLAMQANA